MLFKEVLDVVCRDAVSGNELWRASKLIGAKWVGDGLYAFPAGS